MRPVTGLRSPALRVLAAPVALVLAAVLALTGCGLQTGSAYVANVKPASIKEIPSLKGQTIVVGSKDFDEQLIIGAIALIALKAAGANVIDRTNIKGSDSQRRALLSGGVDVEWEYTGTGWLSYLQQAKPIQDSQQQWLAVKKADAKNGITWLPPAPLDNTYAFAVTPENQQKYNLHKISDIGRLIKENPAAATFCVESEFAARPDGIPGVEKTYGFKVPNPSKNIQTMATGLVYNRTDAGACTFGEVFTTDGRIGGLGLKLLDDDRQFFPIYNAAIVIRTEVLAKYPQIAELFAPISQALTSEESLKLTTKVTVQGQDPVQTALQWMVEKGFVQSPDAKVPGQT